MSSRGCSAADLVFPAGAFPHRQCLGLELSDRDSPCPFHPSFKPTDIPNLFLHLHLHLYPLPRNFNSASLFKIIHNVWTWCRLRVSSSVCFLAEARCAALRKLYRRYCRRASLPLRKMLISKRKRRKPQLTIPSTGTPPQLCRLPYLPCHPA